MLLIFHNTVPYTPRLSFIYNLYQNIYIYTKYIDTLDSMESIYLFSYPTYSLYQRVSNLFLWLAKFDIGMIWHRGPTFLKMCFEMCQLVVHYRIIIFFFCVFIEYFIVNAQW